MKKWKKYKHLANDWKNMYLDLRDKYCYDMGRMYQNWENFDREFKDALRKYDRKNELGLR